MTADYGQIAGRFVDARRAAEGLADYPGALPATLDEAYAIQDVAIAGWAKPVIGWKVGRVPPPLIDRFGADRLTGPIFAAEQASTNGATVQMPVFAEGFAAGEAEFLLRIGATPPAGKMDFSLDEAADLIGAVHVGIEVASSPLGSINEIGPVAVISDFGNNNGMVIGPEISDWRESGFEQWEVVTAVDGAVVGTGQRRGLSGRRDRRGAFPVRADGAARDRAETGPVDFFRRGNRCACRPAGSKGRGAIPGWPERQLCPGGSTARIISAPTRGRAPALRVRPI